MPEAKNQACYSSKPPAPGPCVLADGHDGPHQDANGMTWWEPPEVKEDDAERSQ
jgi:hypothetical protein